LNRRLLTIALAALLAVFGAVAVLAYVRQANDRAVNGLKAETVMVAGGAIPAGTSLREAQGENLLTTEKVPVGSLSAEPVQSVTDANEHLVVSANVAKGYVLLQNMLAKAGTLTAGSNGPVLPLPKGDIEVTMEMCLDADVAGYVQPGSYVAVFDTVASAGVIQYSCTTHQPPSGKGRIVTSVVVARVEVLSVTPASSQGTSSATAQVASDPANPASPVASAGEVLVTLAATNQAQAESLMLVSNAGDPTFGLLATGSVTRVDDPFINNSLQPTSP
jgi:pilus assembly protein CpaB